MSADSELKSRLMLTKRPDSPLAGTAPGAVSGDTQRRSWIDEARGLGIVLVVIGHTLRGLSASQLLPDTPFWSAVDRFIYAFHMPLFFFLAGLFLVPASKEGYLDFAQRRLVRLGYPYLLWASLQTLVQILLSRYTNHAAGFDDLWRIGFDPPMQFWFLYALFLQTLFIGLCAKLGLGRGAILGLSCLLFISTPYLSIGEWMPLNQARQMLVYTALGVFFGASSRLDAIGLRSSLLYAALAVLGYVAVVLAVTLDLLGMRGIAFAAAIGGTIASLSLCILLTRLEGPLAHHTCSLLTRWGEASLAIFVAHTLASAAVRIGLVKALHVENAALHVVLGTLAGIYIPWGLFVLGKRARLPYLFEWPLRARLSKRALGRASGEDTRTSVA